jgi:acyl carrier protein
VRDLNVCLEALVRAEFDLGDVPITAATDLGDDLLIDSLAKLELAMVVEDELDIGLRDAALADVVTFGDLCAAVARQLAARPSPAPRAPSTRAPSTARPVDARASLKRSSRPPGGSLH